MIETMTTSGFLFTVNKYRGRFMLQLEKRKAYRLTIAIFTAITIIVICWIARP